MKKFFVFKLWEYNTYCKIKSIHLLNKMFGRVYMNLEHGNYERSLQVSKGIINFNSPRKKIDLYESNE